MWSHYANKYVSEPVIILKWPTHIATKEEIKSICTCAYIKTEHGRKSKYLPLTMLLYYSSLH